MAYNLTDVKGIKVISNPDSENPVTMTLNKNFKINPLATTKNIQTALNRIYRLSDLGADQIILNSEFNILEPTINYEIISGNKWYLMLNPKGTLSTHEVELNTVENIITVGFSLPYGIYDKAIAAAGIVANTNIIKVKVVPHESYSVVTTLTGKITLVTPSISVDLNITMYINQTEPEP